MSLDFISLFFLNHRNTKIIFYIFEINIESSGINLIPMSNLSVVNNFELIIALLIEI